MKKPKSFGPWPDKKPAHRIAKNQKDDAETMTEEEANELVFGDFADEISLYGLGDIGNK